MDIMICRVVNGAALAFPVDHDVSLKTAGRSKLFRTGGGEWVSSDGFDEGKASPENRERSLTLGIASYAADVLRADWHRVKREWKLAVNSPE